MASNPYQKQEPPPAADTPVKRGWRGGRPEPVAATAKMVAARNHRAKFAAERNELIAVLARFFPSSLMPVAGTLDSLTGRRVVCIAHPVVGSLYWIVSQEEVTAHFAGLPEATNDWDRSNTHKQRSDRLAAIVPVTPTPTPKPARAKPFKIRTRTPKRTTKRRTRKTRRGA